jgi:hemoglobin
MLTLVIMKKDIQTREDIIFLIDTFYKKVIANDIIGYIFTDVVQLNWETHIPVMYDFWDSILFGTMIYKGNPIVKHIALDKKETLKQEHFDEWLRLWRETIETHFEGEKAAEAIYRAGLMEKLILYKVEQSRNPNFVQ